MNIALAFGSAYYNNKCMGNAFAIINKSASFPQVYIMFRLLPHAVLRSVTFPFIKYILILRSYPYFNDGVYE